MPPDSSEGPVLPRGCPAGYHIGMDLRKAADCERRMVWVAEVVWQIHSPPLPLFLLLLLLHHDAPRTHWALEIATVVVEVTDVVNSVLAEMGWFLEEHHLPVLHDEDHRVVYGDRGEVCVVEGRSPIRSLSKGGLGATSAKDGSATIQRVCHEPEWDMRKEVEAGSVGKQRTRRQGRG